MNDVPDPVHPDAGRWGGWSWAGPRHGEHFHRCNYCGSIHPADLAAEPTWRAEWADRKYGWPHKFYVDVANRDPDALFVIGSTNGNSTAGYRDWTAWDDLTPEQLAAAVRDGYDSKRRPKHLLIGTRAAHHGKFYTVHLADPTIDDDDKAAIGRGCGLRFEFADGRVSWRGVEL